MEFSITFPKIHCLQEKHTLILEIKYELMSYIEVRIIFDKHFRAHNSKSIYEEPEHTLEMLFNCAQNFY